jgi:hypothetical protein
MQDILLRPVVAFLKMYFFKRGFLDGRIGLILSLFHAFYVMAKYVKLYDLQTGR